MTFEGVLDFQTKSSRRKELKFEEIERALKKELTEYISKDIKDQTLTSKKVDDKYTRSKVNMRLVSSSISWSKRYRQKLNFMTYRRINLESKKHMYLFPH